MENEYVLEKPAAVLRNLMYIQYMRHMCLWLLTGHPADIQISPVCVFVCSLPDRYFDLFPPHRTSDLEASGPTPVCVYMRDEVRLTA